MPKARGPDLIGVLLSLAKGVERGWDIKKDRGQCVSGSYQNYQNGVVSNQLTEGEMECVMGG